MSTPRQQSMMEELARIMEERAMETLFHEVVDRRERGIFGYEALVRGPSGSPLHLPLNLFAAASAFGRARELELLCIEAALEAFVSRGLSGHLFLNASPATFLHFRDEVDYLREAMGRWGVKPADVILELTEQSVMRDYESMRDAVIGIRDLGCRIAMDDMGAGYSSVRTWSELRPDFVKLSHDFVSHIDMDPLKAEFLRSIIDIARAGQSAVIAEGVETAGECRELADLGVEYLQGFYFSEPAARPPAADPARIECFLADPEQHEFETPDGVLAGRLLQPVSPVAASESVRELLRIFSENEERTSIPVVESGHPVGIVRRARLFLILSKPLHMEVYGRKPVSAVMETDPLCVDVGLRLEQVSHLLTAHSKLRLEHEFILTREGRYEGMARTMDLLKRLTEQQVRRARSANPLTSLPGNESIDQHINALLRAGSGFTACYVDLDNFKPFNDFYGYARGDEVLMHMAQLLTRYASPVSDFVGHIGGDDFVAVFRSNDWQDRVRSLVRDFDKEIPSYYAEEHRLARGITATDRYGIERHFPLLTMTVAAVASDARAFADADAVAAELSRVKQSAKTAEGSGMLLLSRAGLEDIGGPRLAAVPA